MLLLVFVSVALVAIHGLTTTQRPPDNGDMSFPQEANEVAGLLEIRRYGLSSVLVPEANRLRQQYLTAVETAGNSVCASPSNPEFESCSKCVEEKCVARAKHICSTNRYFEAKDAIDHFIADLLPNLAFPHGTDLSADETLAAFEEFVANNPGPTRRKRAAEVSQPFCKDLRTNDTACIFYHDECKCAPICVATARALEAKERFLHAVPGFLSGYNLLMFMLDLTTFDDNNGGFMKTKARVELSGQVFEFFVDQPTLPYAAAEMGPIVARQALAEYYKLYPSRNSDLLAITG